MNQKMADSLFLIGAAVVEMYNLPSPSGQYVYVASNIEADMKIVGTIVDSFVKSINAGGAVKSITWPSSIEGCAILYSSAVCWENLIHVDNKISSTIYAISKMIHTNMPSEWRLGSKILQTYEQISSFFAKVSHN